MVEASEDLAELSLEEARDAICYPTPFSSSCSERIAALKSLGIVSIISYGRFQLSNNLRVVGKGHAAVVMLAKHRVYGIVAVKVRRLDSKRSSLEEEGELLAIAHRTGFVPKPYAYTQDFIVRDFVEGPTLRDYLRSRYSVSSRDLRRVFASLILGFYKLDLIGIDVQEVSKPLTQVIVEHGDPSKPKLVDLESARRSERASSLTRFLGFMMRTLEGEPVYKVLGLEEKDLAEVLRLAREYKRADKRQRSDIVKRILSIVTGDDDHGCI